MSFSFISKLLTGCKKFIILMWPNIGFSWIIYIYISYTHTHTHRGLIRTISSWKQILKKKKKKKKKATWILFKMHFIIRKINIWHFVLLLSLLCRKDYIIQMFALKSYKHLKLYSEVLQQLSSHCLLYCFDFITNKIFQFIICLQPTFKDLILQRK